MTRKLTAKSKDEMTLDEPYWTWCSVRSDVDDAIRRAYEIASGVAPNTYDEPSSPNWFIVDVADDWHKARPSSRGGGWPDLKLGDKVVAGPDWPARWYGSRHKIGTVVQVEPDGVRVAYYDGHIGLLFYYNRAKRRVQLYLAPPVAPESIVDQAMLAAQRELTRRLADQEILTAYAAWRESVEKWLVGASTDCPSQPPLCTPDNVREAWSRELRRRVMTPHAGLAMEAREALLPIEGSHACDLVNHDVKKS